MVGDCLFKKTRRGGLLASAAGVVLGAVLMHLTINVPLDQPVRFAILLIAPAFFIPFASPQVLSSVYDVTLPEVRATASTIESFIENVGAAAAPALTGLIATATSLKTSILVLCLSAWALCFLFLLGAIYFIPQDIQELHAQLQERAAQAARGCEQDVRRQGTQVSGTMEYPPEKVELIQMD
jgi:predicted MFS family arabinose efflux permease